MSDQKIKNVMLKSQKYAVSKGYTIITTEPLSLILLQEQSIAKLISELGANPTEISNKFEEVMEFRIPRSSSVTDPDISVTVQKILERALSHKVISTDVSDELFVLLLSILSEEKTDSCQIFNAYGINKENVAKYLRENETAGGNPLEEFCINLNERASNGEIDTVIGRDTEIDEIIEVLARRKKSNAICVGDPGVGKTAIAEGLAKMIVDKKVPDAIAKKKVYTMEIGTMLAGTKFRGEFEERFKGVIEEVEKRGDVILFIDEMHMIVGAGSSSNGSVDASNLLKPALASGKVKVIGATTHDEYSQHLEKDRALMRRFHRVEIKEPSIEDTKKILHGLEKYYADFHGVKYEKGLIDKAVELSARYIKQRQNPDKSIDLIDSAGARAKLDGVKKVSMKRLYREVAKHANVSIEMISSDENTVVKNLESEIRKAVYGQDEAITALTDAITIAKSGLRDSNKPVGNFLFVGPTGTGKTHISKTLAAAMGTKLVRFDMSEYMEKHSVSKLIGAPPGYVGHGDGKMGDGQLISEVSNNPDCVLLLDEVEKAAPEVTQVLLQVMDDGHLTSSKGKIVDFSNVTIIMTSNLGAADAEKSTIGFGGDTYNMSAIDKAVDKHFPPEFRNRLDSIIKFKKLEVSDMEKIIGSEMKKLNEMLSGRKVTAIITDAAEQWLSVHGYKPSMGARPLARLFQDSVKKPLSKELLYGDLVNGGVVTIDLVDGEISLSSSKVVEEA